MKFTVFLWICFAVCFSVTLQDYESAVNGLEVSLRGLDNTQPRRRLISVQKTITKIRHHVKRARELRKALRAELEKRHRAIAQKMRKQIEKQREEMLHAHKDRMKKLAEQMGKFRKQMLHHREMEASFKSKLKAMQDRLKKIHGVEMTEDGKFKRMKGKFKDDNSNDNEIVAKAVAKAKSRARKRLNKARERMMKVLRQAESPEMAASRKCLKNTLKHMVQVKGHIPHESDPTDYGDSEDSGRHTAHMSKARDHLTKALEASRACNKIHNGPFHQFGEDEEYEEPKKKEKPKAKAAAAGAGGAKAEGKAAKGGAEPKKEKKKGILSSAAEGVKNTGKAIHGAVKSGLKKIFGDESDSAVAGDDLAPLNYAEYNDMKAKYEAEKQAYEEGSGERRNLAQPLLIAKRKM